MTAVPGVPVEAAEAAARAMQDTMNAHGPLRPSYIAQAEAALAAALPSLREVIAAEVLTPFRDLVEEWDEREDSHELWSRLRSLTRVPLSAPVQAAEPLEDDQRPVDLNAIAEHLTDLVDQIGEVGIWGDYGPPAAPVSYVVQTVLDNATAIENRTGVYAEEVGGDDD